MFEAVKERQQRMWASGDFSAVAARIHSMAEHLAEVAIPATYLETVALRD